MAKKELKMQLKNLGLSWFNIMIVMILTTGKKIKDPSLFWMAEIVPVVNRLGVLPSNKIVA